jgi:DNA-binding PadR family transcriptional regulator
VIKRLDVIVLGLLTARPRTGYDIRKWLDEHGKIMGYSAPTSQIYRQMARLVDRNWAYTVADPRSSGPDAKLYVLTDEGRAAFDEWATAPYEPAERPMDPDFQVRMLFTQHLGPAAILELVRTELRYRTAQHERRFAFDSFLLPVDAAPTERAWAQEVHLLLHQRGRLLAANHITWLESAEARLAVLVGSTQHPAVTGAPATAGEATDQPQNSSPPAS